MRAPTIERPLPSGEGNEGPARVRTLYAALFLGTLLLFSRSIGNGFLDYDDPDYVTDNVHVRAGLTWGGARWAMTSGDAANWHPLTWLSHMLDWQVYGAAPAGHHATSVLVHAFNAVLVLAVLRRLTGSAWASAFSAALFAWHPLRVESVAWVAERKDVLSVFFGLLTLLAYGVYAERRRSGRPAAVAYAAVLGAFAAGLMCKPMLVTLPFLLLLLDVWPLGRWRRVGGSPFAGGGASKREGGEAGRSVHGGENQSNRTGAAGLGCLLLEKVPLFLLTAASCAVTYRVQQGASAVLDNLPVGERLANAAVSIARYLGVFLWPSNLSIAYPLPDRWPAVAVAAGLLVGAGGSVLAVVQLRRRPWVPVGWFWFLGTLVPVLGIVQVGMQAMADRYTYLPSLGLEIAGVWTVAGWATTAGRRRVAGGAAAVILGLCSVLTWRQQAVWKSPRTLYEHALAIDPDNYLIHGYLGSTLLNARDSVAAEAHFRRAIALKPDYGQARFRLGLALEREGRVDEAAAAYADLLRIRPFYTMANNRLGVILMHRGDRTGAAEHLQAALLGMSSAELWIDLGIVQSQRGLLAEAEHAFRMALSLEPNSGNANFGLASCLQDLGRTDEALDFYRRAADCDHHSAEVRCDIGNLLLAQGRWADALAAYSAAARLKPDSAAPWVGRGLSERRLGRLDEAVRDLEQAARIQGDFPGLSAQLEAAREERAAAVR